MTQEAVYPLFTHPIRLGHDHVRHFSQPAGGLPPIPCVKRCRGLLLSTCLTVTTSSVVITSIWHTVRVRGPMPCFLERPSLTRKSTSLFASVRKHHGCLQVLQLHAAVQSQRFARIDDQAERHGMVPYYVIPHLV